MDLFTLQQLLFKNYKLNISLVQAKAVSTFAVCEMFARMFQDENVPWYADEKWDFVRGNLSSVDRDYGWAHNLVHNIGTHQVGNTGSRKFVVS